MSAGGDPIAHGPQEVRVLELVVTETMRSERIDSAADVDLEHPVIVLHRFGPWKWRRVVSGEPVACQCRFNSPHLCRSKIPQAA